jgi:predicted thioesterase
MFESVVLGLTGEYQVQVVPENTAKHLGSGSVLVFATPELVRAMERAAVRAVDPLLPDGYRTVGAQVDVRHLAATPVGMTVSARAELVEVNGRKLTFHVEAFDDVEKIGEGTHQRVIIDLAKFGERVAAKQVKR